jgi:hypothetical protein
MQIKKMSSSVLFFFLFFCLNFSNAHDGIKRTALCWRLPLKTERETTTHPPKKKKLKNVWKN